jgi:hypothetical protein
MNDLLPCPCGNNCSLSFQSAGGAWRVVAWPCGAEGPALGHVVVTQAEAEKAWNQWVAGISAIEETS